MKALKIIRRILIWLLVAATTAMMVFTIVSVSTFDQTDRNLFGYKAFIILSDSMSKTDFDAGDLALIKEVDPTTLKEGDIISYISQSSGNFGKIVTHKIRQLTTNANGEPGFITYGTTTDTDDEFIVTYPYILGKYRTHIPKLGQFFQFLKTTPGYLLCIFLPFMLLIVSEAFHCVQLFRKYKAEQRAQLQLEREQLAAERADNQRMMQELLAMKAKLEPSEPKEAQMPQLDPTQV